MEMAEPRELMHYIHPRTGTVHIILETDKTYTVEHSDLYQIYERQGGFKKFKQARAEAKCWANID